jgi:hypothetical protein
MINGILSNNSTQNNPSDGNPGALTIGFEPSSTDDINAYISQLRIFNTSIPTAYQTSSTTNGTSIYTVPTTPITASTSSICTLFTNAGITDATSKNVLETVGNAQISTAQSKFGGSSIAFDGTGDYLITPYLPLFDMWRGDLTVEGWFYFNSLSNVPHLFQFAEPNVSSSEFRVTIYVQSSVAKMYTQVGSTGADRITGTTTLSTGQWYHIALTKSGSTFTLWVNGVSQGTSTTTTYPSGVNERFTVGWQSQSGGANDYLNGYVDDVRITRGYARYTSAFTPPTAAFALQ